MSLSILIWLPAAVGLAAALLAPAKLAPRLVALGAIVALGMAIGYLAGFDRGSAGLQWATDHMWISALGIHYKLGLDGLNVFLVLLTTIVFAAAIIAANLREWDRPKLFYFQLALAESAVLGAFCAQDLILFVAFFDLMLIPFFWLTGAWGGPERVRATYKLVIYTLVGSLLMLAAAVATGILVTSTTDAPLSYAFSDLAAHPLAKGSQEWIVLFFAAAFLVKMPAFPLHGWMPDGYRNMPIPALAAFSGVLSKVAAYGFLRIVLPIYPEGAAHFQELFLLIALASILYGSVMAFTTTNLRLVVGYSSLAQLGFITLGIFSLQRTGAQGALLQMFNHGLVTAPLLLIVALLAARAGGSSDMRDMGGIAFRGPVLASLFLVVALATLAMPGSSNFVGEFFILLGTFQSKAAIAIVAFTGVALASVYMLRAFIRAMHNRVGPKVESFDLSLGARIVLVPLVLAILAIAVYPQVALKRSQATVYSIVGEQGGLVAAKGWTAYAPLSAARTP